jgi:hypothetical protein
MQEVYSRFGRLCRHLLGPLFREAKADRERYEASVSMVLAGDPRGIEGFQLLGLFLGPAIMAALMLLYRELTAAPAGALNLATARSCEKGHNMPRSIS